MVLKADQVRVKALLAETITLLCKNGLHFKAKFSIEGLIGITLDDEDVFLVNINETIQSADSLVQDHSEDSSTCEQVPAVPLRVRSRNDGVGGKTGPGSNENPASPSVKSLGTSSSIPKHPAGSHSRSSRANRQASPLLTDVRRTDASRTGTSVEAAPETANTLLMASSVSSSESNHLTTYPAVSVKNDSPVNESGYSDVKRLAEETDLLNEQPTTKRLRAGSSSATDSRLQQHPAQTLQSSESTAAFAATSESAKSEPLDVIEIKEESLSDDETQQQNYSVYSDYSTAMYGNADAEMGQGFGDASMFQSSSSFYVPPQGDNSRAAELYGPRLPKPNTPPKSSKVRGSYECEKCGKKFTWMAALLQHENNKHGRRPHPFLCQICSKGFWNQRDLRGHMASKHRMQKDFQCMICGREYSYKTYLKVHVRTCHGVDC